MQLHNVMEFRPTFCEVVSLGWFIVATFVRGCLDRFVQCQQRESNPHGIAPTGF